MAGWRSPEPHTFIESSLMNPSAEVICVGTELLLGDILNSNAQFLAQQLAHLGIPHFYQSTVGDNEERLHKVIATACERSRLLIFTGGLGPTPDDLTTAAIAHFFDVPLVERPEVVADIERKFSERGRTMTDSNRKQALLPEGAAVLPNPVGTAPGLIWQARSGLTLMTFPGVPTELKAMWRETAVPYLRDQGWSQETICSRTLKFWGISESALAEKAATFLAGTNPTVAPYANFGEVKLRISARAASTVEAWQKIEPIEQQLRQLGGLYCYGADDDTLASVVGQQLKARGETIAVAESCTGGGLGQLLTDVPGSSSYFIGGVIAYDNRIKAEAIAVDPALLEQHGAVSPEVAAAMATGVRDRLDTTWSLSVTGIAGPGGGTAEKPVGLVYLGIAGPDGVQTQMLNLGAQRGRSWIRQVSACHALDALRRILSTEDRGD